MWSHSALNSEKAPSPHPPRVGIEKGGVDHVEHNQDDFIMLGPVALDIVLEVCKYCLVVLLAMDWLEGPAATCLTFLGTEVDTEATELRLPGRNWNH